MSVQEEDCWCDVASRTAAAAAEKKKKKKGLVEMRDKDGEDVTLGTPPLPAHSRHASSKYDFVKVKVWLGDKEDHYYVLSRFLVSRMLTVTKIPNHVAIKISLELKKLLVDNSLLDVSQSDLEANLFKLMERRGYGEEYVNRYKMMTRFHHQRVPLVILVCGTACVGKSTVATQLAQRLNLPNVLQTDMVYELIRTSTDAPLSGEPIWDREFDCQEGLVTEFARECRIVRKGLNGDLKKAMKDGKPIIIEGLHLDPSIYLMDEDGNGVRNLHHDIKALSMDCEESTTAASLLHEEHIPIGQDATDLRTDKFTDKLVSSSANNTFSDSVDHIDGNHPEASPELSNGMSKYDSHTTVEEPGGGLSTIKQLRKGATKAIIVPIVLRMDGFDHKMLLEEWIACRSGAPITDKARREALINRLMTIQDYLCSFKSQGIIVRNVSATTFPQTLDALHSYLLQRIEECESSMRTEKKETDPR